jgi:hypothetical protein
VPAIFVIAPEAAHVQDNSPQSAEFCRVFRHGSSPWRNRTGRQNAVPFVVRGWMDRRQRERSSVSGNPR